MIVAFPGYTHLLLVDIGGYMYINAVELNSVKIVLTKYSESAFMLSKL